MKNFIIIIVAALFSLPAFAQKDLSQMNQKERNAYLVKLAEEVTKTMGPGWYHGKILTDISGPKIFKTDNKRPEIQKLNGRKFYTVKFSYDEKTSKETGGWKYASETNIWEDDGEPEGIYLGHGYGVTFHNIPYKKMKKSGIYKDYQFRYKKIEIPKAKDGEFVIEVD